MNVKKCEYVYHYSLRMSMMLEWYKENDTSFLSEISADFLFFIFFLFFCV
jgi:hypothetical protein